MMTRKKNEKKNGGRTTAGRNYPCEPDWHNEQKNKKKTASPGHKNGNESFETVTKWRRKRDSKFPNRAARGRRVRQVRERKLTVER